MELASIWGDGNIDAASGSDAGSFDGRVMHAERPGSWGGHFRWAGGRPGWEVELVCRRQPAAL